jgi:hypothetical protein
VAAIGFPAVCVRAETLDSVVASIGNHAITGSDVEQEYRFERFLDGIWPPPASNPAAFAAAREHLTYQLLLTQEENPGPEDLAQSQKSAAKRLGEVRAEYHDPQSFERALEELGMTEAQLQERIADQDLVLRLIDERLRPEATPSDEAIEEYYRSTFAPEFEKKNNGAPAPPLSEVEDGIREVLLQKRINELLDEWITELKPTTNVRFHSL